MPLLEEDRCLPSPTRPQQYMEVEAPVPCLTQSGSGRSRWPDWPSPPPTLCLWVNGVWLAPTTYLSLPLPSQPLLRVSLHLPLINLNSSRPSWWTQLLPPLLLRCPPRRLGLHVRHRPRPRDHGGCGSVFPPTKGCLKSLVMGAANHSTYAPMPLSFCLRSALSLQVHLIPCALRNMFSGGFVVSHSTRQVPQ